MDEDDFHELLSYFRARSEVVYLKQLLGKRTEGAVPTHTDKAAAADEVV